jgi:hypothetical protein
MPHFFAKGALNSFVYQVPLSWCDYRVAVAILHPVHNQDPVLHSIAYNKYLLKAVVDCDVAFSHILGQLNTAADCLSHWEATPSPTAALFTPLPHLLHSHMEALDLVH